MMERYNSGTAFDRALAALWDHWSRLLDGYQVSSGDEKLDRMVKLPASVVEEAFLRENPALTRDAITITCRQGYIQEARICLSHELEPVPCGRDVIKDCTLKDALFEPLR